jgi:hypothetical protein
MTNLNKLEYPLPCRVGVHDEGIPNARLHLRLMPLFLVEHLVVPLHPNGPKGNPTKEMPNFNHLAEFIRDPFTEDGLLPIEAIKVTGPNST